jgi:hypothetical protein
LAKFGPAKESTSLNAGSSVSKVVPDLDGSMDLNREVEKAENEEKTGNGETAPEKENPVASLTSEEIEQKLKEELPRLLKENEGLVQKYFPDEAKELKQFSSEKSQENDPVLSSEENQETKRARFARVKQSFVDKLRATLSGANEIRKGFNYREFLEAAVITHVCTLVWTDPVSLTFSLEGLYSQHKHVTRSWNHALSEGMPGLWKGWDSVATPVSVSLLLYTVEQLKNFVAALPVLEKDPVKKPAALKRRQRMANFLNYAGNGLWGALMGTNIKAFTGSRLSWNL